MHRIRFRIAMGIFAFCLLSACTSDTTPTADADAVLLGRLFDAERGLVIERAEVIVADGRIHCSGTVGSCRRGVGTPVHDYRDALILPGLIDLHVHARPHYVDAFVPAGVTTVRDANNTLSMLATLRGSVGAPRILSTGPMLDGPDTVMAVSPGGNALGDQPLLDIMPVVIGNADDAAATVAALAEAGVDWIKLYEQLPPDAFAAAVATARQAGLPVMVDLGTALTRGLGGAEVDIVDAAHAGVSSNEHLSGLALAYRRRGGDLHAELLDDALLDAIVAEIEASGMSVVPTVGNSLQFESPGILSPDSVPGAQLMMPHFSGFWGYLEGAVASGHDRAHADRRLLLATIPKLRAAGVAIGAGSDLPAAPYMLPGGALHQELAALVQAGLSPAEALQAATWTAARILHADDLGHLNAGARADILVVDGDPLKDILDTRRIAAVWFDGREIDRDAAWQRVGNALKAVAE